MAGQGMGIMIKPQFEYYADIIVWVVLIILISVLVYKCCSIIGRAIKEFTK